MSDWFYAVDGVQYGPVTADDLRRFLLEKRLALDDFVWNGSMPAWTEARNVPELVGGKQPFFAVGVPKLLVMIFGTLGVYEVYWMYKQWKAVEARTGEDMIPLARAIFSIFFFHRLIGEVNDFAREKGIIDPLPVSALTALFVITSLLWRLPDPWWLLTLVSIIPIMMVQQRMNALHVIAVPLADPNRRIRGWNWLAVILGMPLYALTIWSMFTEL